MHGQPEAEGLAHPSQVLGLGQAAQLWWSDSTFLRCHVSRGA